MDNNNNNNIPQQDPMNNQPQQPQEQQPVYQQPPMNTQPPMGPMKDPNKGKAVASLVLGIVSIAISWFISVGAIVTLALGIVGIILANNYKKSMNEYSTSGGLATAGMVLSIIGVACSGIALVGSICVICSVAGIAGSGLSYSSFSSLY
ncbi:MAG: hypothetical protein U0M23_07085 [Acutalibacteraceae bacterium]|nr:hypothetical protein [Acutalibacteraceae bacterium]